MCRSDPKIRCANHTSGPANQTFEEFIRSYPGCDVDPVTAVQAVLDVVRREQEAHTPTAAVPAPHAPTPVPDAAPPRPVAPPLESFGPVDPLHGPFAPSDGSWNEPDPRANQVRVDGQVMHRRREGVYPGLPDAVRVEVGREINNEEMVRLAGIVSYLQRSQLRGAEGMSGPFRDGPNSFVMYQDATKTFSDDTGVAFGRFEEAMPAALSEGTPVRKTNRSGPIGSRAIDGVPDLNGVSLWYDDVIDTTSPTTPEPGQETITGLRSMMGAGAQAQPPAGSSERPAVAIAGLRQMMRG